MENLIVARRNLQLEDGIPRKRSEVQMYMILYYNSRIREAVLKRWAEKHPPGSESGAEVNIPESDIEPQESHSVKDSKIPISYKHEVAMGLYENESEEIKREVRLQREAWNENGLTVRTSNEEDRLTLVREYQKFVHSHLLRCFILSDTLFSRNIPALNRNIGNILRNSECKCAAKGIVWLACPSPAKNGKPVAFLWVPLIPFRCSPLLILCTFQPVRREHSPGRRL